MKNKKTLFCLTLFIGILCFAQVAWAVDIPFKDLFQVPVQDKSFALLQGIFGEVGTVLPGKQAILNTMFRHFNEAMLALATIIIMYTLFMSIINTAHQGEFLGKKFESIWVPIRTVGGFALIIPTPTGYSMIQIFLMWVVIQGIGAADTLWGATINYLKTNNAPVIAPVHAYEGPAQQLTARMLTNSLCMHQWYKDSLGSSASLSSDNLAPDFVSTPDGNMIGFHYHYNSFDCGTILWPAPSSVGPDVSDHNRLVDKYTTYTTQFPQMMRVMNTAAKDHVFDDDPNYTALNNPLYIAASNLNDALENVANQYASQDQVLSDVWQQAIDFGWIYAGAYYHSIAELGNNLQGTVKLTEMQHFGDPNLSKNNPATDNQIFVNKLFNTAMAPNLDSTTTHNLNAANANPLSSWSSLNGYVIVKMFNIPVNRLISLFAALITGQENPADPTGYFANPSVDPLIKIQALGDNIMYLIEVIYLVGFSLILGIVATMGMCSGMFSGASVLDMAYRYVLTPITWLMMMLFTAGLTMAVYIPLVPYIIFTFAAIGWMIAVIETMVAAPLVALGITHPEGGHELLGRAEPAIMMITNVFLRPSMMLFGLIAGMVLSYVAIDLFNSAFSMLIGKLVDGGVAGGPGVVHGSYAGLGPVQLVMYLVVYVVMLTVIINRSFSLIHIIPDNVLKWIGGNTQFGEYAKGEEQVKGGFSSGAGKAQEAAGAAFKAQRGAESSIAAKAKKGKGGTPGGKIT